MDSGSGCNKSATSTELIKETTNKETTHDLQRNKKAPNVVVNFAEAVNKQTASMQKVAEERKKNSGLVVNFAAAVNANINLTKQAQSVQKSSGLVINHKAALRNNAAANFIKLAEELKKKDSEDQKNEESTETTKVQENKGKIDIKDNEPIEEDSQRRTQQDAKAVQTLSETQKDQETSASKDKSKEVVKTLVVGFDQAIEDSKTKVVKYDKDGKRQSREKKDVTDKKKLPPTDSTSNHDEANDTEIIANDAVKKNVADGQMVEDEQKHKTKMPKDKTKEDVQTLVVGFDQAIEESKTNVVKYDKDGKQQSLEMKGFTDKGKGTTTDSTKNQEQSKDVEKEELELQRNKKAPTLVVNFAAAVQKQTEKMAKMAEEKKKAPGLVIDFAQAIKDNKTKMAKIAEEKKKNAEQDSKPALTELNGQKNTLDNNAAIVCDKKDTELNSLSNLQDRSEKDETIRREDNMKKFDGSNARDDSKPKVTSQFNPSVNRANTAPIVAQDIDGKVDLQRTAKTPSVVVNFAEAVEKKVVALTEKATGQQIGADIQEKKQDSLMGRIKKAITGESDWKNVVTKHQLKALQEEKKSGLMEQYIKEQRHAYKPKPIKEIIKERQNKTIDVERPVESPNTSEKSKLNFPKKNDSLTTLIEGLPSEIAIGPENEEKQFPMEEIRGLDELPKNTISPTGNHQTSLPEEVKKKMDTMTCDEIVQFMVELNTKDKGTNISEKENIEKNIKHEHKKEDKDKPKIDVAKKEIPLDNLLLNLEDRIESRVKSEAPKPDISHQPSKKNDSNQLVVKVERKEIPLDKLLKDFGPNENFPLFGSRSKRQDVNSNAVSEEQKIQPGKMKEKAENVNASQKVTPGAKQKEIPLGELLKNFDDEQPLVLFTNKEKNDETKKAVLSDRNTVLPRDRSATRKSEKEVRPALGKEDSSEHDNPEKNTIHITPKQRGQKKNTDPCDVGAEDFCDYLDRLTNKFDSSKVSSNSTAVGADKSQTCEGKQDLKKLLQHKVEHDICKIGSEDMCDYFERLTRINHGQEPKNAKAQRSQASRLQNQPESVSQKDVKDSLSVKKNGVERMPLRKAIKTTNDDLLDQSYVATVPAFTRQRRQENLMDELFGKQNSKDDFLSEIIPSSKESHRNNSHVQVCNAKRIDEQKNEINKNGVYSDNQKIKYNDKQERSYFNTDDTNNLKVLAGKRGQRRGIKPHVNRVKNSETDKTSENNDVLGIEELARSRGQKRNLKPVLKENTEPQRSTSDDGPLDIEKLASSRGRKRAPVGNKSEDAPKQTDVKKPDIEELANSRKERHKVLPVKKHDEVEGQTNNKKNGKSGGKEIATEGFGDMSWLTASANKTEKVEEKKTATEEFGDMSWLTTNTKKLTKDDHKSKKQEGITGDLSWLVEENVVKKRPDEIKKDDSLGDMSWLTKSAGLSQKSEMAESSHDEKSKPKWLKDDKLEETATTAGKVEKMIPTWLKDAKTTSDNKIIEDPENTAKPDSRKKIPPWLKDGPEKSVDDKEHTINVSETEVSGDQSRVKREPTKITADIDKDWNKAFDEMFNKNYPIMEPLPSNSTEEVPKDLGKDIIKSQAISEYTLEKTADQIEYESTKPATNICDATPLSYDIEDNTSCNTTKYTAQELVDMNYTKDMETGRPNVNEIEHGLVKEDDVSVSSCKAQEAENEYEQENNSLCIENRLLLPQAKEHDNHNVDSEKSFEVTLDQTYDASDSEMMKMSEDTLEHAKISTVIEKDIMVKALSPSSSGQDLKVLGETYEKPNNIVCHTKTCDEEDSNVKINEARKERKDQKELPVTKNGEQKQKTHSVKNDSKKKLNALDYPSEQQHLESVTQRKENGRADFHPLEVHSTEDSEPCAMDGKKKMKKMSKKYVVTEFERLHDRAEIKDNDTCVTNGRARKHKKSKHQILVEKGTQYSSTTLDEGYNQIMEGMLMEIAATAHNLAKAKATLKESEERYSRKCKVPQKAKIKEEKKQKSFADMLDDEIVAVVTHSGYEPFPEHYRTYNDEDEINGETPAVITEMQRDSLLPEWANGINHRKSKKQSTGKRRIQTVQQKDKNNPHQFDWEEALEKPNALNKEETELNQKMSKRKTSKKAKRYVTFKRYPEEVNAAGMCDPDFNRCYNCGCHLQEMDQNQPNEDKYTDDRFERTQNETLIQNRGQKKQPSFSAKSISMSGKNNVIVTENEPSGKNPVVWNVKGGFHVQGDFYSTTPVKEKSLSTMGKIKNVFKKLKLKK